jgi:ethanolamine ammonia-lyase small subunit
MDQVDGHGESITCQAIVVVEIRKVPGLVSETSMTKYCFHQPDVG